MNRKISNDESIKNKFIKEVQALAKQLGRTPFMKEFQGSAKAAYRFGSWNNFLREAGLEVNLVINDFSNVSNEELLMLVRKELMKIGSTTFYNYNKYKSNEAPSFDYVKGRTGLKWNGILEKLGLNLNLRDLTNEELLEQLINISKEIGKTPSINDLLERGINATIYHYKFGSYNKAVELAGLDANFYKKEVIHSNEELLGMYIELCKRLGKAATSRDIDKYLDYNSDVFVMRFSSINELRKLAGYETIAYTKKHSKESIEYELIKIYKRKGGRITNNELRKLSRDIEGFPSINTICRNFSTTKISEVWEEIEKDSTLNYLIEVEAESKELIIQVQKLAEKIGRTPTVKDFKDFGLAIRKFGSWNNFILSANLKPNAVHNELNNHFEKLTKSEIFSIVRREFEKNGSTKSSDYTKYKSKDAPSYHYIVKKTGLTWSEMLLELGYPLNNPRIRHKKEITMTCIVPDCKDRAINTKGYCNRHNTQIWRLGKIKDEYTEEEMETFTERRRAVGARFDNKTGVKGVRQLASGPYQARIVHEGKEYHLGTYKTLEEAKQARVDGEIKYWGKAYSSK